MSVVMGGVVSLLFVAMATSSVVHGVAAARSGVSTSGAATLLGGRGGRVTWLWVAAFVGGLAAWLTIRGAVIPVSAVVVLPCCFAALATLTAEHVTRVGLRRAHNSGHDTQPNHATRSLIVRALTIVCASAMAWLILDMWVRVGGI